VLAYVADVFGHTLVVPPFFIRLKLGYNGGSFFVKRESILNKSEWRVFLERVYQFIGAKLFNLSERYRV
jgi:hypothetical protein